MDVLMVPSFLSPTGGEAATSPQTAIRNIFDDTLGKDPKTFLRNPSVYGISPDLAGQPDDDDDDYK